MFVPVKSKSGKQVTPTNPNKAGVLIRKGLATPYWSNGIFCIRLNYETEEYTQDIAVGVDPGSKKEGFTVKSESHTYLNVQADAHNKVGKRLKSDVNFVEVDVPVNVRIVRIRLTVLLTEKASQQGHVPDGIGS